MKKGIIISIGAAVGFMFLSGCDKKSDDKCLSYTTAEVTKVEGSNIAMVNQEIDLTVSYYLNNSCGQFKGLETTSTGNSTLISLKAKYEGCACAEVLLTGQIIYKFKAEQAGIYYLKFLRLTKTYFTDTITVN